MRGCLLGSVTAIAIVLVALAVWFGAVAVLDREMPALPSLVAEPATPTVARVGDVARTPTPGVARATPVVARPTATAPAPTPTRSPAPAKGETQLARVTEAELTEVLRRELAAAPDGAMLEEPAARLGAGRVVVSGIYRGLFVPIAITVTGTPAVQDRRPRFVVESVEGAGVELPASVRETINQTLGAEGLIPAPAGVEVTRIEVGEGVLAVYGYRQAGG